MLTALPPMAEHIQIERNVAELMGWTDLILIDDLERAKVYGRAPDEPEGPLLPVPRFARDPGAAWLVFQSAQAHGRVDILGTPEGWLTNEVRVTILQTVDHRRVEAVGAFPRAICDAVIQLAKDSDARTPSPELVAVDPPEDPEEGIALPPWRYHWPYPLHLRNFANRKTGAIYGNRVNGAHRLGCYDPRQRLYQGGGRLGNLVRWDRRAISLDGEAWRALKDERCEYLEFVEHDHERTYRITAEAAEELGTTYVDGRVGEKLAIPLSAFDVYEKDGQYVGTGEDAQHR